MSMMPRIHKKIRRATMMIKTLLFLILLVTNAAPNICNGPLANPFGVSKASVHRTKSEISMGTTLVALCCKDGVVVGADTRTSVSGFVSNRYAHKLTPLSPNIIVCRSGSAADTQQLCDEARWELESLEYSSQRVLQVSQVAKLLRSYMVERNNMQASLLCAGLTSDGEGRLYTILPSGALFQHETHAVSGSGSTYIMGYLDEWLAKLEDELVDEDEAIALVGKAIQLAMDRDGSSGGFIRIYSVTAKGTKVHYYLPITTRDK